MFAYFIKSASGWYEHGGTQKEALASAREYSYTHGKTLLLQRRFGTMTVLYIINNGKAHKAQGDERRY